MKAHISNIILYLFILTVESQSDWSGSGGLERDISIVVEGTPQDDMNSQTM